MADAEALLDLTLDEVISARIIGLAAIIRDLEAAEDQLRDAEAELARAVSEAAAEDQEGAEIELLRDRVSHVTSALDAKRTEVDSRASALRGWPEAIAVVPELRNVSAQAPAHSAMALDSALSRLRGSTDSDRTTWVLLEALVATELPKKQEWAIDKTHSFARAVAQYAPDLAADEASTLIDSLRALHKRARKRITKDAMPPGMQATIGVVSLGLALVVPGSEAVGGFVGGLMGYHGAAATSAGLAFLGGGSLASGGFGMAGGALVAGSMMKGVEFTTRRIALAQIVARTSSTAFISELAMLDVRCAQESALQSEVVARLKDIETKLHQEWDAARPNPADRRRRVWGHLASLADDPSSFKSVVGKVKAELPQTEEKNLATSVRALQYEIRYLESPEWKRISSAIPRFFGVPIAARLIDSAETLLQEPDGRTDPP